MFCGIAKAEFLEEEAPRLETWLKKNLNGEMQYMENHFDKRLDPRLLVDGARSVISLGLNYYTDETQHDPLSPKISRYAYGTDYHYVIKDKLKQASYNSFHDRIGEVNGRAFVDSAPVLDRAWAKKAGMGWIGKNSQPHQQEGWFILFFGGADHRPGTGIRYRTHRRIIAELAPAVSSACPTAKPLVAPYIVDGSRCVSLSLTIELKNEIPARI